MNPSSHVADSLLEARDALDALIGNPAAVGAIVTAAERLTATLRNGGRIFSCGNGGSMCDAMHFAEELSGRYRLDRPGLPAVAIADPGHLTCVANDYGYEHVFSRYLQAHAGPEDMLVAITTSGTSRNVIAAARHARDSGLAVIGLTGRPGSPLSSLATVEICTPGGRFADRVQELHIKVIHILIELVERELFPANYPPVSS